MASLPFDPPRPIRVRLVSDAELENQLLLRDSKAFLRNIAVPRRRVVDWLYLQAGASTVQLVDQDNRDVGVLDLSPLERTHFDLWYRGWIAVQERHVQFRIKAVARERVRLLISLLRVIFPKEAATWGRPALFFRALPNTIWMPTAD